MNKLGKQGMSYIEVIIAAGIFALAAAVAFATISQAITNQRAAELHYNAGRHATGILLAVQGSLAENQDPAFAANTTAARFGVDYFSVWVNNQAIIGGEFGSVSTTTSAQNSIAVAIYNRDGIIIGRAAVTK